MNKYDFDYSPENIEKKIASFMKKTVYKRGPFYNGNQSWEFSNTDNNLFYYAVWQGYLDASRTFKGVRDTKTNNMAFGNLADSIRDYFVNNITFDHKGWCDGFMSDIEKNNGIPIKYGQAQKVLNMAFKYLYCCTGSDAYYDKFEKCHVPIDGLILEWLYDGEDSPPSPWSIMNYEQYDKIQGKIRMILKENCLAKEFVIWDEMKKLIEKNCK